MADLSQEQIDKLKAAHPGVELHQITVGGGDREVTVVVKVPNRERWMRWKAQIADTHRKANAMESLVVDSVVHPSPVDLGQLLEVRPGLAETFGDQIAQLAGLEERAVARKL